MTVIASGFSASKPISCAQGRYGELIIAQGGGVQPKRWTGSGTSTNAGIVAPAAAPTCTLNTTPRYYVARTDVTKPGAVYHTAPAVTYATPSPAPTGFRTAKASAHLNQTVLNELRMIDGGKHYPAAPAVTLSGTHGTGAVLTPVMDGTVQAADSITHYEVIQGPPFDDETDLRADFRTQWAAWGPVEIPLANGSGTIDRTIYIYHGACEGGSAWPGDWHGPVVLSLPYTISGVSATGTGAKLLVNFYGHRVIWATCEPNITGGYNSVVKWATSCFVRSVKPKDVGTGYATDSPVTITITPAVTWDTTEGELAATIPDSKKLIIEGYPPGHSKNTSTPRMSIKSITVTNGGSGYVVAPDIKIASPSGFGAYATAAVSGGAITSVTLESGGGGYKLPPTVTAVSGGAEAAAVARPHLRGKYQCYYRYVDNTTAANGGPIPSNLSPVREVDAGDGAQSMTWAATAATNTDGRTLTVELWRTTGDQALMLYRVGTGTSLVDDLTDDEVRDPDRAGYAAMPIVLPNGDLNAMRFTPPPSNKAVVVRYQDRFWYAVDTAGSEPNSIYFSEVDEPESVPDINEFVLQQNARDGDAIKALVPFGSSMLVMQSRHAYSLSYSKQPLLDADVSHIANRGCINQRCWDVHDGLCYAMDQHGVYAVSPQGEIKDVSAPIGDLFRSRIDWSNTTWNFLLVDAVKKVLRAFVVFSEDGSSAYPTRALCYSVETGSWWMERYPHRISAGAAVPMAAGYRCAYGGQGGVYMLDTDSSDAARGAITKVTVTNKGAGYLRPPTVTASGGVGAEFSAVLDPDGRISGIWILNPGYGYSSGNLTISAPEDTNAPVQATATYTATATNADTAISPVYRYKSGNRAYPTDATAKGGGQQQSRDISVTYKPQPSKCDLAVRLYYNNSPHARPNAVARDRGAGFVAGTADGAARLDMAALATTTGQDSGVAKASFSGRSIDDFRSSDRHVAVELLGARTTAEPVVIYGLDVYGAGVSGD